MARTLIVNAKIVNEGKVSEGDVLIVNERIEKVGPSLSDGNARVVEANGRWLMPGAIDDQVHFREPGLTHKACIRTESRAAVAGGVTSFMEMPNTMPPAFTQTLLDEKYAIAARDSAANYSFFIGAGNDNLDEVLKTDLRNVCGLKIFMGSSTGNLLVDDPVVLEGFFSRFPGLIATHCEHEPTIQANSQLYRERFGDAVTPSQHPEIRSEEACYASSSFAVDLARRHGTRLHILHISTARELALFDNSIPLGQKKITAEACIHHLWFSEQDYGRLGNLIKWNPAIKKSTDREAIRKALLNNVIDVVATDHAPHTLEEKSRVYWQAPSGGPLVQHSLQAMLEFHQQGWMPLPRIAELMSHRPAILFRVNERGFIREGYFADLVLVDNGVPQTVNKPNILAQCGWSPFEGQTFSHSILQTYVSGQLRWNQGSLVESGTGKRLTFLA